MPPKEVDMQTHDELNNDARAKNTASRWTGVLVVLGVLLILLVVAIVVATSGGGSGAGGGY
jgi:CHASE3 domain sensor protein